MGPLVDRTEFRKVLKDMVNCIKQNLDRPGVSPLTPDQILFWMQNVTLEDVAIVAAEIEADGRK